MIQEAVVHVWHVDLNRIRNSRRGYINYLDDDELKRYSSYVFDIHKERFAKRRYILKRILASYLESDVEQVRLSYHAGGKPYLSEKACKSDITFNLSHCDDWVVVAVTKDNSVGVDVERIDVMAEVEVMARMIMSDEEFRQFDGSEEKQKCRLFYRLWSRKESVVKALGVGLSYPIQKVEFTDLSQGKYNITVNGANHTGGDWKVYDFELLDNFASAIAARRDISRIVVKNSEDITQSRIIQT